MHDILDVIVNHLGKDEFANVSFYWVGRWHETKSSDVLQIYKFFVVMSSLNF